MPKKIKTSAAPAAPARPAEEALISRRGKIVIGAGAALASAGYYVLTLTDPAGQNWASNLCPFLILGGYALIGVGILLPDPDPAAPAPPNP
jgi:hypothetical protein